MRPHGNDGVGQQGNQLLQLLVLLVGGGTGRTVVDPAADNAQQTQGNNQQQQQTALQPDWTDFVGVAPRRRYWRRRTFRLRGHGAEGLLCRMDDRCRKGCRQQRRILRARR